MLPSPTDQVLALPETTSGEHKVKVMQLATKSWVDMAELGWQRAMPTVATFPSTSPVEALVCGRDGVKGPTPEALKQEALLIRL
jgi:hypothetical protein